MIIFSVDPGKKTGWCIWRDDGVIAHGEHDDWLQFLDYAHHAIFQGLQVDHVVCESYIISMETVKKTRQYEPLMIIGSLFWLAHQHGVPMTLQSRNIKSFSTDTKLKNLGWMFEGDHYGGHARDAGRHLLAYLENNKLIDPERYLGGES